MEYVKTFHSCYYFGIKMVMGPCMHGRGMASLSIAIRSEFGADSAPPNSDHIGRIAASVSCIHGPTIILNTKIKTCIEKVLTVFYAGIAEV